jgi:hypothetical protein
VLHVEWPLFGELSRALALKVSRAYDPEVVVGVANAGVIPGAVIAAMLGCEFHSIMVSRRFRADSERDTPAIFGAASGRGSGPARAQSWTRPVIPAIRCAWRSAPSSNAGASEVRTAVEFKTGSYEPDFHALPTESTIELPWDREVIVDGELGAQPCVRGRLREV